MSCIALNQLPEVFFRARRRPDRVVLEGFHPLKHALQFGANIEMLVAKDPEGLWEFCQTEMQEMPEMTEFIRDKVVVIPQSLFDRLGPEVSKISVMAIANRPGASLNDLLSMERPAPTVVLENPSHMGNIGATIRVAAGAGASGVIVTGQHDPWHPAAVRGAAGLQFALPVVMIRELPEIRAPLIAVHPQGEILSGETLGKGIIPYNSILVFGSESKGLTKEMLTRVDRKVSIPMQPGVSSLNLATSVAVILYAWRLGIG